MGNKMWLVTITAETGPAFRALVRADKMEQAITLARADAEERGILEKGITTKNMGPWPSAIILGAS